MRVQFTERFRRVYSKLTDKDADRVDTAIRRLATDPRYPGLRVKKIQGADHIWEARASRSLRLTFEIHSDLILLRNVGSHDETLNNP